MQNLPYWMLLKPHRWPSYTLSRGRQTSALQLWSPVKDCSSFYPLKSKISDVNPGDGTALLSYSCPGRLETGQGLGAF